MSGLGRRCAAILLVVCLLSAPVQAQIIPFDPIEPALLQKIALIIKLIQQFRMEIQDGLQVHIYNRLRGYAFPEPLFNPIVRTTAVVTSLRREMQRLGCNFPFSPRTANLRQLFLDKLSLCRSGHQEIWGSHDAFWDQPIEEMNDYVATMTSNMISERIDESHRTWVRAHGDLFELYAIYKKSPGEANRAEAAGLAWAGEVAVGNNQIVTQDLLVRQMNRDLDRFDQKKATDLSHYTYRGLSTMSGRPWMPTVRDGEVQP